MLKYHQHIKGCTVIRVFKTSSWHVVLFWVLTSALTRKQVHAHGRRSRSLFLYLTLCNMSCASKVCGLMCSSLYRHMVQSFLSFIVHESVAQTDQTSWHVNSSSQQHNPSTSSKHNHRAPTNTTAQRHPAMKVQQTNICGVATSLSSS